MRLILVFSLVALASPTLADGIGYSDCVRNLDMFQTIYGPPNIDFLVYASLFGPGPVADAAIKMQKDHDANAKILIAAMIAACKAAN